MLRAILGFVVGVYVIVLLVLTVGLSANIPFWVLGATIFVLVVSLSLWLGLKPGRKQR
jgi:MFS superfamily sulfate permease-like transporter